MFLPVLLTSVVGCHEKNPKFESLLKDTKFQKFIMKEKKFVLESSNLCISELHVPLRKSCTVHIIN